MIIVFASDIELALMLVFFVWVFNWIKAQLGNTKIALLIAAIVTYFTVFKNPALIWIGIIFVFMLTYGKQVMSWFEKSTK